MHIELLGRFRVSVGPRAFGEDSWPGRRSAELVQLLALSAGFRLVADQVLETLWPHLDSSAAAANLRKAAHYARRTLGEPQSIVLRHGWAELFPSAASLTTDALEFEEAAAAVLQVADTAACAEVAATYGGDMLPLALYEEWTQAPRHRLRSR
jgi:DNA-binding SARP family transcriptional activator